MRSITGIFFLTVYLISLKPQGRSHSFWPNRPSFFHLGTRISRRFQRLTRRTLRGFVCITKTINVNMQRRKESNKRKKERKKKKKKKTRTLTLFSRTAPPCPSIPTSLLFSIPQ
ncbi:hypothetical protein ACN42_g10305 [Penicillium freii]|uniref:Secreted protein n=1 Tax=Penicillium freii TaxID=48697 RepID=A0A124GQ35_PENFR|nr:hypothetical protein ACN42_g10305 [Penicillium freii]